MLYWSAFNKHLTKLLRHSFRRTESLHTPHFLLKHLRDGTQLSVSNPIRRAPATCAFNCGSTPSIADKAATVTISRSE